MLLMQYDTVIFKTLTSEGKVTKTSYQNTLYSIIPIIHMYVVSCPYHVHRRKCSARASGLSNRTHPLQINARQNGEGKDNSQNAVFPAHFLVT